MVFYLTIFENASYVPKAIKNMYLIKEKTFGMTELCQGPCDLTVLNYLYE